MAQKKERACKYCMSWCGDKFQTSVRGELKYLGDCRDVEFHKSVVCIVVNNPRVVVSSEFACKYHEFI